MHIVIAILGAMGIAVFWWYRLKFMSEAASEAADAVGRVQGHFRRNKLRKKAAIAPITAIDDPVTAAITIIAAIASEDAPLDEAMEQRLRGATAEIADTGKKVDEAVGYAKWATNQVADVQGVIDHAGRFLATKLDEPEKRELVAMLDRVVPRGQRTQVYPDRVRRLKQKLGLEVDR